MNRALINFPQPVAATIAGYLATYQIAEWVRALKFPQVANEGLSDNPMAIDVISAANADWPKLCENSADWAVDLVLANPDKLTWYNFARNQNPRAFEHVKAYAETKTDAELIEDEIDEMLSTNPCAIGLLRGRPALIHRVYLMWNPEADKLIEERKIAIDYPVLALNPSNWAAKLLLGYGFANLPGYALCGNPNPQICAYILAHPEMIDKDSISGNPEAIGWLRANPDQVSDTIYSNPAIFELTISDDLLAVLLGI